MLQLCPQGPLHVERLIEVYGRKGNMSKWLSDLKGDGPKRDAHSLHERCDLLCPDLPKVDRGRGDNQPISAEPTVSSNVNVQHRRSVPLAIRR